MKANIKLISKQRKFFEASKKSIGNDSERGKLSVLQFRRLHKIKY